MNSKNTVRTPCIGVCSTGIGDLVCRGCKRYAHEIIRWNSYSDDEKMLVLNRLNQLLTQVISARVNIFNETLLRQACTLQKIPINYAADPHCWVFDLLKAGASQIPSLEVYGCSVLPEYAHCNMVELKEDIDKDFYILSEVHYQRYFSSQPTPETEGHL